VKITEQTDINTTAEIIIIRPKIPSRKTADKTAVTEDIKSAEK
jgi:hypothetical protein